VVRREDCTLLRLGGPYLRDGRADELAAFVVVALAENREGSVDLEPMPLGSGEDAGVSGPNQLASRYACR
jgi:hypothetical protein